VPAPNAAARGAPQEVFTALAADLQPLRERVAQALELPDGEMEAALDKIRGESGALFRLIDDSGALPAALARRAAQAFADGAENKTGDTEA